MKASLTVRIKQIEHELDQLRLHVPNPTLEWGIHQLGAELERLRERRDRLEEAGVEPSKHLP